MNIDKIFEKRYELKEKKPLIHCITNPISINQCANLILSLGARPIMAEHPREVKYITATSDALMINLGNITDARIKAFRKSLKEAKRNNIPYVIDLVGISCSKLRFQTAKKLLKIYTNGIIKGNYSEIFALCNPKHKSSGVDADKNVSKNDVLKATIELWKKYHMTIVATGEEDIITDINKAYIINNGTEKLSLITGTGCMAGALSGCFLSVATPLEASIIALSLMSVSGENAKDEKSLQSFFKKLMEEIECISNEKIIEKLNMEILNYE